MKSIIKYIYSLKSYFGYRLFLNIACLITLVLFVTIISLISNDLIEHPYHSDNFITLTIVTPEPIKICIDNSSCEEHAESPEIYTSQASGLAIRTENGRTYILTADHFCRQFKDGYISEDSSEISIGSLLNIYTLDSKRFQGRIVYSHESYDLCLVEAYMMSVDTVKLANSMPKMSEKVYAIAAPAGISGDNTALHFEGRFSGCTPLGECFFTIPATQGSSGGIITNRRGEMVGMIQMASPYITAISIGIGVDYLFIFLYEASAELEVNLLY